MSSPVCIPVWTLRVKMIHWDPNYKHCDILIELPKNFRSESIEAHTAVNLARLIKLEEILSQIAREKKTTRQLVIIQSWGQLSKRGYFNWCTKKFQWYPLTMCKGSCPCLPIQIHFYWECSINNPAWIKGALWLICCGVGQQRVKGQF